MGLIAPRFRIGTALRGKNNKYYMFRNLDRLRSLKLCNILFILLTFVAMVAVAISAVFLLVWLLGVFISLGRIPKALVDLGNNSLIVMCIGIGLLFLTIIIRAIIELSFAAAEKKELKAVPEGSEKYLKVMAAYFKIIKVNIITIFLVLAAIVIALVLGSGQIKIGGSIFAVMAIIALSASRIVAFKEYNSISAEIQEIKAERKENKKLMIN